MSSSRMRRAASADRLSTDRRRGGDLDFLTSSATSRCDLVGFPYCCTKHYYSYRRWPYYLDPADYPYYNRHYHRYWPDWPYSSYYDYCHRRPWYYHDDDYYGDYLRGYTEGMKKYDDQRKRSSIADLSKTGANGSTYLDSRYPSCWWHYRPYYYRSRYLL